MKQPADVRIRRLTQQLILTKAQLLNSHRAAERTDLYVKAQFIAKQIETARRVLGLDGSEIKSA